MNYKMVLIGRFGYGFTLMFGLPLVFLPCREALVSIPKLVGKYLKGGEEIPFPHMSPIVAKQVTPKVTSRKSGITKDGHVIINGIDFDEERPLLKRHGSIIPLEKAIVMGNVIPMHQLVSANVDYGSAPVVKYSGKSSTSDHSSIYLKSESSGISLPNCESSEPIVQQKEDVEEAASPAVHVLSTFSILLFGYICAVAVPGVGIVWRICGSSMALIIGFFIPAACYLKIRSRKKINPRSIAAWTMTVFSVVASIVCTLHVVADARLGSS